MPKLFISSRREDTAELAVRLGRQLKDDRGFEHVFLDTHDLWAGQNWRAVLDAHIRGSDAVMALVGPRWAGGPDGRRIHEPDDMVRWELRHALETGRALVPIMVDGARLPERLPSDVAALADTQWIDLDPSDSPERYQELLADLFYKAVRREGDVVVVSDGSERAEIHLTRLATLVRDASAPEARELVRVASRGFAALSLGAAADRWPDVIVLRRPDGPDALLDAREAGVRRNTSRVAVVAATGGAIGAFVADRLVAAIDGPSPATLDGSPAQPSPGVTQAPCGGPGTSRTSRGAPTGRVCRTGRRCRAAGWSSRRRRAVRMRRATSKSPTAR